MQEEHNKRQQPSLEWGESNSSLAKAVLVRIVELHIAIAHNLEIPKAILIKPLVLIRDLSLAPSTAL